MAERSQLSTTCVPPCRLAEVLDRSGRSFWCGFGEPTFRWDLITQAAPLFHDAGCRVRLNTNGHACLIHGRDVLPELAGAVDEVSVSLNAPNCARYVELSRPVTSFEPVRTEQKPVPTVLPGESEADALELESHFRLPSASGRSLSPERFWEALLDFLTRAKTYIPIVQASVVGFTMTAGEIERARRLAASLGVSRFRVR